MASGRYQKALNQGVEAWNKWRDDNHHVMPEISNIRAINKRLIGLNLHYAHLRGSDLSNSDLSHADLRHANATQANLSAADLNSIAASNAILVRAKLTGVDLVRADLRYADLRGANLAGAKLIGTDLIGANLQGASLAGANLACADLHDASLNGAFLNRANLYGSDLTRAHAINARFANSDLQQANLQGSYLLGADMSKADLSRANLGSANLSAANLLEAKLNGATVWSSNFADIDLSGVYGLEEVKHLGRSEIGLGTFKKSRGQIPRPFLRGCGLGEWEIEAVKLYRPDLTPGQIVEIIYKINELRSDPFIQFHSCFISYSSKDEEFAKKLFNDLQSRGVRCWFAPEHMKIGDRIRTRLDESIQVHDKLLLVLSENSIASQWIEQEVETALEKEREQGGDVLFPIRLDNTVMDLRSGWPALIKKTRHIGDFQGWKNIDSYYTAFNRLLKDLRVRVEWRG